MAALGMPLSAACKSNEPPPAPALPTPASIPVAAPPPTPDPKIPMFVDFVAGNRSPRICEAVLNVDQEVITYLVTRYFKARPGAVRFSIHFKGDVTCANLGGATSLVWREREGVNGASGEHCQFRTDRLKGLEAVIEKNREPGGALVPSVHIFSPEYLKRDTSFAQAARTDEANAR
jgi:hypothetical protein